MNSAKKNSPKKKNELTESPLGISKFYTVIAIIIVIIPELLAELTFWIGRQGPNNNFSINALEWDKNLELKLATMNFYQLRKLARTLKLFGYSGDLKPKLRQRLLKRMIRKTRHDKNK